MRRRIDLPVLIASAAFAACHNAPKQGPRPEDLRVGGTLAARYVHEPFDRMRVRETCKVWHELFAPDGRRISKGLGGEFEHHRGLFLAFNKTIEGGRALDFWHCRNGETQQHSGYCEPEALGLAADFQVATIDWKDPAGRVIVRERRALRAVALDARTWRFDLVSELRSDSVVMLSGDPHHSGCQFRALAEFAEKDGKRVTYVRPPTAVLHANDEWTECAWMAMALPLDGEPVTVLRCELPGNPAPVRWSSRDYGRFGATFAHSLQPGAPLRLCYAWFVALGALDVARCEQLVGQLTAADGSGSERVAVR